MSEDTQFAINLFLILSGISFIAMVLLMVAVQIKLILDKKKPKVEEIQGDKKVLKRVLIEFLLILIEVAVLLLSTILPFHFKFNFLFPVFLFLIIVVVTVRMYIWKKNNFK